MRPKYNTYYLVWVRHREKKSPPKSEPLQQTANAKAPKSAGKLLLLAAEPEVAASAASARTNPTPLTTTVVTVLRLGPHQIRRPVALPTVEPEVAASSVQDRTKDILVVVSGLLFGLGCGALTASSMYLVWSLLASTRAPPPTQAAGAGELRPGAEDPGSPLPDGRAPLLASPRAPPPTPSLARASSAPAGRRRRAQRFA